MGCTSEFHARGDAIAPDNSIIMRMTASLVHFFFSLIRDTIEVSSRRCTSGVAQPLALDFKLKMKSVHVVDLPLIYGRYREHDCNDCIQSCITV